VADDLAFALSLADTADAISLPRFRAADLHVETKPDLTPVSEADRAVEAALRERIALERGGEPVFGEEEGGDDRSGWVIDPIDGTRNYTRGIPVWATLISLGDRVAVVSAPALGRRWWAELGGGAYADGQRLRVSGIGRVEDATVLFAGEQRPPALASRAWHPRGFGDFWAHMLVAEGAAEVAIDAVGVSLWDLLAVKLIVEEAGGRFTDFAGAARADGGTAVSSNGLLHDEALAGVRETAQDL
jgi:histidinol-phosphatase